MKDKLEETGKLFQVLHNTLINNHCVKYARMWAFSKIYFPVQGQNHRQGKCESEENPSWQLLAQYLLKIETPEQGVKKVES